MILVDIVLFLTLYDICVLYNKLCSIFWGEGPPTRGTPTLTQPLPCAMCMHTASPFSAAQCNLNFDKLKAWSWRRDIYGGLCFSLLEYTTCSKKCTVEHIKLSEYAKFCQIFFVTSSTTTLNLYLSHVNTTQVLRKHRKREWQQTMFCPRLWSSQDVMMNQKESTHKEEES